MLVKTLLAMVVLSSRSLMSYCVGEFREDDANRCAGWHFVKSATNGWPSLGGIVAGASVVLGA